MAARKRSRKTSPSGREFLFPLILVFLLITGLITALWLSVQQQDLRQDAASSYPEKACAAGFSENFATTTDAVLQSQYDLVGGSIVDSQLEFRLATSSSSVQSYLRPRAVYSGEFDAEVDLTSFTPEFLSSENTTNHHKTFSLMAYNDTRTVLFSVRQTLQETQLVLYQWNGTSWVTRNSVAAPSLPVKLRLIRSNDRLYAFYLPSGESAYKRLAETEKIFSQPLHVLTRLSLGESAGFTTNVARVRSFALRCLDSGAKSLVGVSTNTTSTPTPTPTPSVSPTPVNVRPADRRAFVIQAYEDADGDHRLDSAEKGLTTTLYWDRNGEEYWRRYETSAAAEGRGGRFDEVRGGDTIRVRNVAPPYVEGQYQQEVFFIASNVGTTTARFPVAVPKPTPVVRRVVTKAASPSPTPVASVEPSPTGQLWFSTPFPSPSVRPTASPSPTPVATEPAKEPGLFARIWNFVRCLFGKCE